MHFGGGGRAVHRTSLLAGSCAPGHLGIPFLVASSAGVEGQRVTENVGACVLAFVQEWW